VAVPIQAEARMSGTQTVRVNTSGGVGLGGLVFVVFLVLKLTGHIDWSWWWVTAPLWGVFVLAVAFMLLMLVGALLGLLFTSTKRRR
jgi:hypothetical protein